MAVDRINKSGGINGRPVEIIVADDESKPDVGRRKVSKLLDEDQVDVEMHAGENAVLVKLEQRQGPWAFSARVLEAGAIAPRAQEIGPSLTEEPSHVLAIRTDITGRHASEDAVTVKAVGAGGTVFAETRAPRGRVVRVARDPGAGDGHGHHNRHADVHGRSPRAGVARRRREDP